MPLLFLSGTFFPINGLPKALSLIVKVDPLSYGVDGLRGALSGVYGFGLWPDFLVLTLIALILTVIGSYLFSKIQI
jgi:ABC-2 type transport system permease protein